MPCPRNPFRALRIIAFMRTVMGCCVGRAFLPWNNSSKKPVSRITPTNFRLDPLVSPSFFHRSFFRSPSIRVFSLRFLEETSVSVRSVGCSAQIGANRERGGRKRGEKAVARGRFSSELKKRVVVWNDVESGRVGRRRAAQGVCTLVSRSG